MASGHCSCTDSAGEARRRAEDYSGMYRCRDDISLYLLTWWVPVWNVDPPLIHGLLPRPSYDVLQVNHLLPDRKAVEVPQTFQLPNTTTIHTHGLHISPDGVADNIFRHLGSGEEALSVYEIPKDHQREFYMGLGRNVYVEREREVGRLWNVRCSRYLHPLL